MILTYPQDYEQSILTIEVITVLQNKQQQTTTNSYIVTSLKVVPIFLKQRAGNRTLKQYAVNR